MGVGCGVCCLQESPLSVDPTQLSLNNMHGFKLMCPDL
jgi:hypothetical protein